MSVDIDHSDNTLKMNLTFELATRPHSYAPDAKIRKEQTKEETRASVLLLKANRCFDVC
ncbi:unnamed protein product, partial [Mesorhabditis spiculigera]